MPHTFNTLLMEAGLTLEDVRLLRHKDKRATKGRTPYNLWLDNLVEFEKYQSTQRINNRSKLKAKYWASFIVTPSDETMFVGVYSVTYRGLLKHDTPMPQMDGVDKAGSCDDYILKLENICNDQIGKLFIDWGPGYKAWIQRADRQKKPIIGDKLC